MDSTTCNKRAAKQKKIEIKTIIDDIRQLIETYGFNHDEKTMNTLKRNIKKYEDLLCDEEDDDIEDLNNCIRSLNFYKAKVFREYQQSKDNSTYIETPEWINNKKCTINPQNKHNKCFQYSITLFCFIKNLNVIQKEYQRSNHLLTILNGKVLIFHHKNKTLKHLK